MTDRDEMKAKGVLVGEEETHDRVKDYYGKVISKSEDLQTNACCPTESIPDSHKAILSQIDDEILTRYYGCGSPLPQGLEGCTVLDLGCGTGRDSYLASKLVGEKGQVIGVDMTDEQLAVAQKHVQSQADKFGFSKPNTRFIKGYLEHLEDLDIEAGSIDVVISNCVFNLVANKEKVFQDIFRLLKPGGELYFSDVYADRRIPEALRQDDVLYGECLSGALYKEDFRRIMHRVGFLDYRLISDRPITIENKEIEKRAGYINFYSTTVRAFKLESLEDICEDYGQVATYTGGIEDAPHAFTLDDHHTFHLGKPVLVCGNTASMLEETRFKKHFEILGNRSTHYGVFDCAPAVGGESSEGAACC